MAYQTGTASTISDILDAVRGFALAQSWTVHHWDGTWLSISNSSGSFFNYHAESAYGRPRFSTNQTVPVPGIRLAGATGYDGGLAWDSQPGVQTYPSYTNDIQTPIVSYHLYGTSEYIHTVIQITAAEWAHIPVGIIDKHALFTGGHYAASTSGYISGIDEYQAYNSYPFDVVTSFDAPLDIGSDAVYADIDSVTEKWHNFNGEYGENARSIVHQEFETIDNNIFDRSINPSDNSTVLIPISLWVRRPDNYWSMLGTVKDMRYVNMTYLQTGDVLTIGSDEWICYPVFNMQQPAIGPTSYPAGFAYRKII